MSSGFFDFEELEQAVLGPQVPQADLQAAQDVDDTKAQEEQAPTAVRSLVQQVLQHAGSLGYRLDLQAPLPSSGSSGLTGSSALAYLVFWTQYSQIAQMPKAQDCCTWHS